MGWRRGCLDAGSVRGAVPHYCLGGCSAMFLCARGPRLVIGDGAGTGTRSPPSCFPLSSRPSRCGLCVAPFGCFLPSPACTPFHAVCAFRELGPVAFPVRAVCSFCVCVLMLPRCVRPPLAGAARALRAVPVQDAGRAVPDSLRPSAFPALILCSSCLVWGWECGGPPAWLRVVHPLWGGSVLPLMPLRPGQCGARGEGSRGAGVGRSSLRLPAAVPTGRPGWAGGHWWWGVGSCIAQLAGRRLVSPSAPAARGTKRASIVSHWPWRVQPPYCSGSCSCAAAWAPPNGGVARRPVALVADWRCVLLVGHRAPGDAG